MSQLSLLISDFCSLLMFVLLLADWTSRFVTSDCRVDLNDHTFVAFTTLPRRFAYGSKKRCIAQASARRCATRHCQHMLPVQQCDVADVHPALWAIGNGT